MKICFSGKIMSENFDPRNPLVVQALAWLIMICLKKQSNLITAV